jgi:hypothetical protein
MIKITWISTIMKMRMRSRIQGMAALLSRCGRFGIEEWLVEYTKGISVAKWNYESTPMHKPNAVVQVDSYGDPTIRHEGSYLTVLTITR